MADGKPSAIISPCPIWCKVFVPFLSVSYHFSDIFSKNRNETGWICPDFRVNCDEEGRGGIYGRWLENKPTSSQFISQNPCSIWLLRNWSAGKASDWYAVFYQNSDNQIYGEVLKWSKRRDSKSRRPLTRRVGSNPTFSARKSPKRAYACLGDFLVHSISTQKRRKNTIYTIWNIKTQTGRITSYKHDTPLYIIKKRNRIYDRFLERLVSIHLHRW